MKSAYALLLDRCGLSHREAAELRGVRIDTVKSWAAGRNPVPSPAVDELRQLYAQIERAAGEACKQIAAAPADTVVELGLAGDDDEARALGWPCVGAHGALLGLIVARAPRQCVVVRRGSTPGTAAAVAAHGL